jgi:glycosyltransferase involved in cell wall biosynthesis
VEDRFRPADGSGWRNRLGIPPDAPVIGAVGKLAEGRGFELLLETTARLVTPTHGVAVGHGERLPQLQKMAINLGLEPQKMAIDLALEPRVHWAGYQDEALTELYSAMDVVLFTVPGSDWGHRVISEAQGCGRPVVAASWPGVEDLVEDGVSGRIVDHDPAALADAVEFFITNPDVAHLFGDAAATAAENRRLAPIGRRLAQFLEEVLTQKKLH